VGIKVPQNRRPTNNLKGHVDALGKYHIPVRFESTKRAREVISIDSPDGKSFIVKIKLDHPPAKRQVLVRPGNTSRHFLPIDVIEASALPSPLEREARSRGLASLKEKPKDELFANPYQPTENWGDDFKGAFKAVKIPGEANKRRDLVQSFARPKTTEPVKSGDKKLFRVSWVQIRGEIHENCLVRINEKVIFTLNDLYLDSFNVSDAKLIQVWLVGVYLCSAPMMAKNGI
jgi:hypothetical protein